MKDLLREWFRIESFKWESHSHVRFVLWGFFVKSVLPLSSWLLSLPLALYSLIDFHSQPCQCLICLGTLISITTSVS